MRAGFVFIAAVAGLGVWMSDAQSPAASRPYHGGYNQNNASQKSAPSAPVVVPVAPANDESKTANDAERDDAEQAPRSIWERITGDPLMALLTVGLLFFAGWQTIISRTTARQQLRAYIALKDASADRNGLKLSAVVQLANVGQTPAKDVQVGCTFLLVSPDKMSELRDYQYAEQHTGGAVWGPGLDLGPVKTERTLTNDEALKAITNKTALIVLVGRVDYTDVFKRKRWTVFRYVMEPSGALIDHESGGNDAH
jgi:hypothetical protein